MSEAILACPRCGRERVKNPWGNGKGYVCLECERERKRASAKRHAVYRPRNAKGRPLPPEVVEELGEPLKAEAVVPSEDNRSVPDNAPIADSDTIVVDTGTEPNSVREQHTQSLQSLSAELDRLETLRDMWRGLETEKRAAEEKSAEIVEAIVDRKATDQDFALSNDRVASLAMQIETVQARAVPIGERLQGFMPVCIARTQWLADNWLSFCMETEENRLLELVTPAKRELLRVHAGEIAFASKVYAAAERALGETPGESYEWSRPIVVDAKTLQMASNCSDPLYTVPSPLSTVSAIITAGRVLSRRLSALLKVTAAEPTFSFPPFDKPAPFNPLSESFEQFEPPPEIEQNFPPQREWEAAPWMKLDHERTRELSKLCSPYVQKAAV